MCGKSSVDCGLAITNQTVSVLDFALTVVETVVTAGGSLAAQAAVEAAEAAITTSAKAAAKGVSKAAVRALLVQQAKEAGQSIGEAQILNLTAMAVGEKFDFTSLDPTGIAAIVEAYNKPICNVLPATNIPISPNLRLIGQAFAGEAGDEGIYLVSLAGTKHKLQDARYTVSEAASLCGMIGPGDITKIKGPGDVVRTFYTIKSRAGWAGLQAATGAAGLPRGQNFNVPECQAMAAALKAYGKWKFIPTPQTAG